MNGFVESFRVLEQSETNGSVRLKAEVQISASGIENFALASGKGSAQIGSNSLLGDISRDDLARTSRSQIIRRLFEGFPTQAFDVKVKKVEVDPVNRGQVIATVEVQINKIFVKNLKSGLKVIGRSGDSDYRSPDQLTVCFTSSPRALEVFTDCKTAAIDSSALQLRQFNANWAVGSMSFLLWFSGGSNSASPAVFESTYLESIPGYQGRFSELPGTGQEILTSGPSRVSGGVNGRVVISEEAHLYRIKIPRQDVPDGATQIHAMPLFVDARFIGRPPVALIKMFDPRADYLQSGVREIQQFDYAIQSSARCDIPRWHGASSWRKRTSRASHSRIHQGL